MDSNDSRADRAPDSSRRRRITQGAAGLMLGGPQLLARADSTLPDPRSSGIDHIVVLMMENRSFDHFMGWVPGADGQQADLSFTDSEGGTLTTRDLAPEYQGCPWADPSHSYNSGRTHCNGDAMDGFLLTQPVGDPFPAGYYTADSLPFYAGCASNWTICDRYHSGILASTWPNRIYMHAGQTDRIRNDALPCHLPTIWDLLGAAHVPARYYFTDLPMLAIWGPGQLRYCRRIPTFFEDAAAGTLPSVSFVDPRFINAEDGNSADDHPVADIRAGQAFLNEVYEALVRSPQWERTLLVINYDEWGGFFDHVPPPYAPVSAADAEAGNDGRLGIRVPCVLIGPRAYRGSVCKLQLDPNSILNFISWRFGLPTLGARGESSLNLAYALNWDAPPNPSAPIFSVPPAPVGRTCDIAEVRPANRAEVQRRRDLSDHENEVLMRLARQHGYV